MKIENILIKDIKPYERNAKKHDETQIKNVMESIKQFGIAQPLVIDKEDVLIIGHCRLIACKRLKMKEVPVVRMDDLTQEQVDKLRLLDNKLNESEWDFDLLAEDIPTLDFSDFDIDWDLPELNDETEIVEDEAPEPDFETEPITKLGDIWELGGVHRLICGDSTDVNVIDRLMDGERMHLALTDPPYGVNIVQHDTVVGDKPFGRTRGDAGGVVKLKSTKGEAKNAILKAKLYMPIIGDESTKSAEEHYKIISERSDIQILFGGNYFTDFLPPSRCWIVWDKGVPEEAFFAPVELAWCSKDGNAKLYKWQWSGICREGERSVECKSRIHPTQKPVGMLANIIKEFTEENQNVIDGFGGSGSTLIACEQLNRKCYMCELDPHYVDVIVQRYINLKESDEDVYLIRDGKKIEYKDVI